MLKLQKQKILSFLTVGAILVVPLLTNIAIAQNTHAISKACQNSTECMAAVAAEQAANKAASEAVESANEFQQAVKDKDVEIAAKQREIAETEAQIADLNKQIEETEKKLARQRKALAELLTNMYVEGDTEPIMILVGSSSIADLAERQTRNDVIKQQISTMAQRVKDSKTKLEEDKVTVENLLAQQKADRAELVSKRAEKQALVEKYQDDAEAYQAAAAKAREAQRAAEEKEQNEHPERYRGTVASGYTGANTYPWQEDCPQKQDYYITYWSDGTGTHKVGGYVCECVSYAGWKAYEAWGIALGWGNAYSWDDGARADSRFYVDHTPAANTIGQADGGAYGHVFWVESVNSDGSINVSEYNNAYATYLYSGDMHYGDFGTRRIAAGDVWQYNFIHLR